MAADDATAKDLNQLTEAEARAAHGDRVTVLRAAFGGEVQQLIKVLAAQQLRGLEAYADDPAFRKRWREVKRANKSRLAEYVHTVTGIELDPSWMFDVQVKRIHEYKRQHLMALGMVTQYLRIRQNPGLSIAPRAYIFGGKAAPGYRMAKLIIKLINSVDRKSVV